MCVFDLLNLKVYQSSKSAGSELKMAILSFPMLQQVVYANFKFSL